MFRFGSRTGSQGCLLKMQIQGPTPKVLNQLLNELPSLSLLMLGEWRDDWLDLLIVNVFICELSH